jgi:hypothetical protein
MMVAIMVGNLVMVVVMVIVMVMMVAMMKCALSYHMRISPRGVLQVGYLVIEMPSERS